MKQLKIVEQKKKKWKDEGSTRRETDTDVEEKIGNTANRGYKQLAYFLLQLG